MANAASGSSSFSVSKKSATDNSRQITNKKRVQKNRITADFLRNLPDGVTYIEKKSDEDQEPEELVFENLDDDVKEGDIV